MNIVAVRVLPSQSVSARFAVSRSDMSTVV